MRALVPAAAAVALLSLVACSAPATPTTVAAAPVVLEQPWVRTTDGATNQTMTALFVTLVNPGQRDVRFTKASCEVAGQAQIHEMAMVDGKKTMRELPDGLVVKAGSHEHLAPGGSHVMLMELKQQLKIGDETTCTLTVDGVDLTVKAPVKAYTEEEPHYHDSPSPSAGASMSASPSR